MKMKKRNGFTLVELLAVMVILAIVLIIAVPGILSVINKAKQDAHKTQLTMVIDATKLYVAQNNKQMDFRKDGVVEKAVVNLSDLKASGFLDKKILDPRDKSEIKDLAVLVKKTNSKINYEIVYTDQAGSNYPVFSEGMIPIVYKENQWVKADSTNEKNGWFDYTKQQWANVATVTEDVRQTLLDAPDGTVVPMDKINAMFTWIPRFKYKLFNVDGTISPVDNPNMLGNYTIDTRMEGRDIPKSTGTQNGEWLTHPAFTFGTEELDGFWMSKFQTGYNQGTDLSAYTKDGSLQNIVDASKVLVKPSINSWRGSTISNTYHTIQNITAPGKVFGLTTANDAHLIKNMEWGAILYLSMSSYGKAGNGNYQGQEKLIRVNNNDQFLTGCAANQIDEEPITTCNTYDTQIGQTASTTGNITGVYDTSSRCWNFTATTGKKDEAGNFDPGISGFPTEEFNQLINSKYLDVYEYAANNTDYSISHLGDGIIELGPYVDATGTWHTGPASIISIPTWLTRGGISSYTFAKWTGGANTNQSGRIVII